MRSFNFKAKLIGDEKYLTYIMGEETELDEDVLDYCEENGLKELVKIIYEEDDDYDYLTYDVTGQHTIDELIAGEMKCEDVLVVLRNIANGLISLKEQAVKLNYILLNRQFMYVDEQLNIRFICLPVESSGGLAAEFKGFVRQFLANIRYDVEEDLGYVGKLLTYINGDNFNLRGLVGLSEALMDEAGISFEEVGGIEADGVEVMNSEEVEPETDSVKSFMDSFAEASDEPLPEIGDDDDDESESVEESESDNESGADDELDSILPAGMKFNLSETEEDEPESEPVDESVEKSEPKSESEPEPESKSEPEPVAKAETTEKTTEKTTEENTEAATEEAPSEPETPAEPVAEEKPEPAQEPAPKAAPEVAEEKPEPPQEPAPKAAPEADKDSEDSERGKTDNLKAEEPEPGLKPEPVPEKTAPRTRVKETDPEVLKSRIKALAGNDDKPGPGKSGAFKSEQEMNDYFENKPPVIKKNSVKVNRAAIIQNIAASEEEAEQSAKDKDEQPVPVIEEIAESTGKEKEKKAKSNSILSKNVDAPKQSVNVVNIAKAMPYLVRVNTEERIMLRKDVFKIGKASIGVDYTISGNGAISRQHAVIIRKDDVSYIKDNKSTNHTYVNGKKVEDGEEVILTHDSVIRLGDEEFTFKIR